MVKKYKTISEVSHLLKLNTHVIRYWDSKFDGLSTRLGEKKQRFFNNDNIKKIKDLQANLYQNGKIKYPLDLAKQLSGNYNKNQKSQNLLSSKKNKQFDVAKLVNIKENLVKLINSI